MYSMRDSTVWIHMEDPDKLVTWEVDLIPLDAYAVVFMEQNFSGCSTAHREFYVMSSSLLKSTLKACQINQSRHELHVGVHHVDRHRGRSHSVTQLYCRTPFTSHTLPLVSCVYLTWYLCLRVTCVCLVTCKLPVQLYWGMYLNIQLRMAFLWPCWR
jgi:hypothetical protein